jgi:hypothetical protein
VNQVDDKIAELREQIANLALIDQMKSDERKNNDTPKPRNSDWSGRTSWTELVLRLNQPYETPVDTSWHRDALCFRCNEYEHISKNCQAFQSTQNARGSYQRRNREIAETEGIREELGEEEAEEMVVDRDEGDTNREP